VKVGKRVAFGPELEVGNRTSFRKLFLHSGSELRCAWHVDVIVPTARKQFVRYKLFGGTWLSPLLLPAPH
jgi:hypothetical protein